jgi:MFS family permease
MFQLIRTFSAPLLSLILLILGSGLFNTFVSIRLELAHYSAKTTGAVTAALYLGILLGSLKLGGFIEKVGHIRAFTIFAIVSTFLVLAQALWIDPIYWAILRLVCGICTAGIFIVIESWLLMQSPASERGAILSLYLAVFYAALSAGQFLINLSDPESIYPFCITAGLFALSTLPILIQKVQEPKIEKSSPLSMTQMIRISPLGFLGGVISGMLLAVIYGLVPFYGKEIGMEVSEIGTLMGVIIFGGLSFQWPLGRWADKTDRRRVLNTASFMTTVFAIAIALMGESPWLLLPLGWFFGGFSFTIYPLSMAYVCEKIKEDQIVSATGGFVLSYGIGAIGGPLIAPFAMSMLGTSGLFYFLAMIALFLCFFGLRRPTLAE